jgi:hypothetical protein
MSYRFVDSVRAGPGPARKLWICEISASSWFYYIEICYDARPHERKKNLDISFPICLYVIPLNLQLLHLR